MTLNDSVTLNQRWHYLWAVSTRVLDNVQKAIKVLTEVCIKVAEVLKQALAPIVEAFKNFIKDEKQESFTSNNSSNKWRYYNYKPQPRVNTKGYAPSFLPVTRRFI